MSTPLLLTRLYAPPPRPKASPRHHLMDSAAIDAPQRPVITIVLAWTILLPTAAVLSLNRRDV
jgi:hypothetical protein